MNTKEIFINMEQFRQFEAALIKQGMESGTIQDIINGKMILSFYPVEALSFKKLLSWLQANDLDSKLLGGLEKQVADQERFYKKFYGSDFKIDREKIFIEGNRLPAIKAGLMSGCINYGEIIATPNIIEFGEESKMTDAEFFMHRLMKPQKNDGLNIWAENSNERPSGLTLSQFLAKYHPLNPQEVDLLAFKRDCVGEMARVFAKKSLSKRIQPGMMEIVFTSDAINISTDQKVINIKGEAVILEDYSYLSAISNNVRILSNAEGIVLAAQLYARDGSYIACDTFEWRRDMADCSSGNELPGSVSFFRSVNNEIRLSLCYANQSISNRRFRLSL